MTSKNYANVVVRARWTVDISLDSSVVELLTSDAGVPVRFPVHKFFVFIHSSHPHYTKKKSLLWNKTDLIIQ